MGVLKKILTFLKTSGANFILSITFKAIDPQEGAFPYCWVSLTLCALFEALAFESLRLVSNKRDLLLSWSKSLLTLKSTNPPHKL